MIYGSQFFSLGSKNQCGKERVFIGPFQLHVLILLPTRTKFKLKKVQSEGVTLEGRLGGGCIGQKRCGMGVLGRPFHGEVPPAPASCSRLGAEPVLGQRLLESSAPDRAVCVATEQPCFIIFSLAPGLSSPGLAAFFPRFCPRCPSSLQYALSSERPPPTDPAPSRLTLAGHFLEGRGQGGASEHLTDSRAPGAASGTRGPQEGPKSDSPQV